MSSLTRKLTEHELAAVENEPAPVAHETFTQIFAVDRGELEVLDEDDDATPPKPARIGLAVWVWSITMGSAAGALIYAAGGGQ